MQFCRPEYGYFNLHVYRYNDIKLTIGHCVVDKNKDPINYRDSEDGTRVEHTRRRHVRGMQKSFGEMVGKVLEMISFFLLQISCVQDTAFSSWSFSYFSSPYSSTLSSLFDAFWFGSTAVSSLYTYICFYLSLTSSVDFSFCSFFMIIFTFTSKCKL